DVEVAEVAPDLVCHASTSISHPDHHQNERRISVPHEITRPPSGPAVPRQSPPRSEAGPAVSCAITEAMPMTAGTTEEFKAIVIMANRVASGFNEGAHDTCIVTSYALAAALTDLGYADARPVRVEAASVPDDCKLHAVNLGGSLGSPRRRARDGYWCGH